mgnify:CR=1 FL=1|tara:strand:- start:992 stop:1510 length:519 start_codon:yes stop_codon:yes gene_type:complete
MNLILKATQFSALKHQDQKRKDGKTPYIIHPISVAIILSEIGGIDDEGILSAALLHDTIEDTDTTADEIGREFGPTIRSIVEELTDDQEISYSKRKRLQIDHAPNLSKEATLVKIADKISNVTDIINEQPFDWDDNRCKDYIEWAETVINNCQKVNRNLENHFFNLVNSYHL